MSSAIKNGTIFEFADFRLIPAEELLLRNGEPVHLNPKSLHVLAMLVERHGHLVSKSEIIDTIWEDAFVEEGSLAKSIWFVRNALGDTTKERFIQTVPRRGYRFVSPVTVITNRSGAFRRAELNGHDEGDVSSDVQEPAANGLTEFGKAPERPDVFSTGKERSPFFRNRAMLAGLAGIVLIAAYLGYYGFVRKSSAGTSHSIVVLPVAPITPGDRNDLLSLGIADSLINRLASAEGLLVRPLTSVRDYAETVKDPVAVGHEQKTDYVLASAYQVSDGNIKITAQLYNVNSGGVEYTLQKQTSTADLFKAQDEIAADFGNRLMQRFGFSSLRPVKPRGTNNEEAYLAFVQGMYLLDHQNPGEENGGSGPLVLFEKAVALDPKYAKAWAGKALAHDYAGINEPTSEHHRYAQEAIDRALSIDPKEALAFTALCHHRLFHEWNYAGAEDAGRRAVELDPNLPIAHIGYAVILDSMGRYAEAIDHLKQAMELEPTSFRAQANYANALYLSRRYEEAEVRYKQLIDIKPDRKATYWWLVQVMEAQGKELEAVDWTVKLMAIENKGEEAIQRYKAAYESGGYRAALLERMNSGLKLHAYVLLGEKDKAFEGLEKQYQRHGYHLAVFGIVDPQFDPLRSDPRWADLERRVRGN